MLRPDLITRHWPLTHVMLGDVFQTYPTRHVVQLHTAQGTFAAKVDLQPPAREQAIQSYAVFDYLAAEGFSHAPHILKTHSGQPLVYTEQQSIAVMEFLGGSRPEASETVWAALGAIARSLNTLSGYSYRYAIDIAGVIAELSSYAQAHPESEHYLTFVSMLMPLCSATHEGLIHGEINLANTARHADGRLALLDWDEAGHGPTVLEAGYPLITVFLGEDRQFRHDLARAFYRQYYAGNAPNEEQRDLVFRAALLHGLRSIQWANQQQRWERVCYAVAQREQLLAALS